MEHVPTGFPDLDKILDSGLNCPCCICITGQSSRSQRSFTLQMVSNFLHEGLKGLYVCLDRPAPEIRSQFKRLGIDVEAYDHDYRLFFVDFFTYSQNALIESSTLQNLGYNPHMLLETLSPFLDWIKNGFIIIDTLSTLTLNMESKEAYDFVRGIKMLGRAFNLVIVGTIYKQPSENSAVMSNSDGTILFTEQTVTLHHFERPHPETLAISSDKDGKVALKSPQAEVGNQTINTSMLSVLSDAKVLKAVPTLNLVSSYDAGCLAEDLPQRMEPLIQSGTVTQTSYCSTLYCPNCSSQALEFYLQCPECQNRVLEKGEILEHFKCGNVDFEDKFCRANKIVCAKCNQELKQLGVDYRKVGVGYHCGNRHLFMVPKMVFVCAQCRDHFDLADADLKTQFSYELTEKGKLEAAQTATQQSTY